MAKKPGSIWIENNELHYVDTNGAEWFIQGEYWGSAGGRPGSLWISNADSLMYYTGSDGLKYRVGILWPHSDANAKSGVWVEVKYLCHAIGGAKFQEHGDHVDGTGGHIDSPHGDGHTDGSHGDSHGDGHTDSSHGDSHTDVAHGDGVTNHTDGHNDYYATGPSGGGPGSHADGWTQIIWPDGSHNDDHYDSYGTYQVTPVHTDYHYDTGDHDDSTHGDLHTDGSHGDGHNDVAHVDGGHGDIHNDSPHQDGSGGGSHYDQPVYVGP